MVSQKKKLRKLRDLSEAGKWKVVNKVLKIECCCLRDLTFI